MTSEDKTVEVYGLEKAIGKQPKMILLKVKVISVNYILHLCLFCN